MIKKVLFMILFLVIVVLLFIAAFFAFAPEDRIHSAHHWYKLKKNDPIAHCLEFYKKDFLSPESVRFVEGSIEEDINDNYFHMRLSGLTQGGGRAHTSVTCVGKFGTQAAYKNKENSLEFRVMENIRVLREDNKRLVEENARR